MSPISIILAIFYFLESRSLIQLFNRIQKISLISDS